MKKILIVLALVAAVGVVLAVKQQRTSPTLESAPLPAALPRLVDLGAGKCMACKMMKPVLDSLVRDFAGRLQVEFIDVWENPEAGQEYGLQIIPTQIFFSPAGEELFRHEGFMSREDILAKWSELGYGFQDE